MTPKKDEYMRGYADGFRDGREAAVTRGDDAEVLFSLTQGILQCRTLTDFVTVQTTVQAIAKASQP